MLGSWPTQWWNVDKGTTVQNIWRNSQQLFILQLFNRMLIVNIPYIHISQFFEKIIVIYALDSD